MKDNNLQDFKQFRHHLCTLADNDELETYKDVKEVNMFLQLYKSNGYNCPYLLALCKAIKITNKQLYNRLERLNGK